MSTSILVYADANVPNCFHEDEVHEEVRGRVHWMAIGADPDGNAFIRVEIGISWCKEWYPKDSRDRVMELVLAEDIVRAARRHAPTCTVDISTVLVDDFDWMQATYEPGSFMGTAWRLDPEHAPPDDAETEADEADNARK
jgi:hypothetical protein